MLCFKSLIHSSTQYSHSAPCRKFSNSSSADVNNTMEKPDRSAFRRHFSLALSLSVETWSISVTIPDPTTLPSTSIPTVRVNVCPMFNPHDDLLQCRLTPPNQTYSHKPRECRFDSNDRARFPMDHPTKSNFADA